MHQPAPQARPRWRPVLRPALRVLWRTALLALVCSTLLELIRVVGVEGQPWRYKTPSFALLFLLGTVAVWLLVALVHAVLGRLWLTASVMVTLTVVVGFADFEKVRFRQEPLFPSDWSFVQDLGLLIRIAGMEVVVLVVVGVLVGAVAAFLVLRAVRGRAHRRTPPEPMPVRPRLALRVLTGVLSVLVLGYITGFNGSGNVARRTYESFGAQWMPYSQQRNYLRNGFIGGFLWNLDVPVVAAPPGYSEAAMDRVVRRYTAVARRTNRGRDARALDGVNVVMVLSESFSDPRALRGVSMKEDPIPFTRKLMRSTTSGPMLAQNIGGGTANMEFEALTGMSMQNLPPQVRSAYQQVVPAYPSFPSAVRYFSSLGDRTVAIHPFTTEMYRRREVYDAFGFDEFVYDDTMADDRRIGRGGFISDAAAFAEVRRQLVSESDPVFANLVTMQNHVPYTAKYDDTQPVTGPDGERIPSIEQYVRGLSLSDRAMEKMVRELRQLDEPTVLVFYGDHLPGTYPSQVITDNGPLVTRQTPFFVWSNFPARPVRRPLTSPTHFMDLVLDRVGAAVPPYYALLRELRSEVPAMENGRLYDSAGRRVAPGRLSDRATRLLRDQRLVQYDLSVGKRYSQGAMFAVPGRPDGS